MVRNDPPSAPEDEAAAAGAGASGASLTLPSMVLEIVVTAEQLPTAAVGRLTPPPPRGWCSTLADGGMASPPPLPSARVLPSSPAIKSR